MLNIDSVLSIGDKFKHTLRWLNGMHVKCKTFECEVVKITDKLVSYKINGVIHGNTIITRMF